MNGAHARPTICGFEELEYKWRNLLFDGHNLWQCFARWPQASAAILNDIAKATVKRRIAGNCL